MNPKCHSQLYHIFENHLINGFLDEENEDTFVAHVVEQYAQHLKLKTLMPLRYLEEILEDTANDVYDMLYSKIYGHFNLNHYRQSLKSRDPK